MVNEFIRNNLLSNIKNLIDDARKRVSASINVIMIQTYWEIGRLIVEEEQKGSSRAAYGDSLLLKLSRELGYIYGRGFSRSNLQSMRLLYLKYEKCQTLSGNFNWSHYLHLLQNT
ncbi:MAG: hypothetical protein J6038_05055 [Bacilli bacterium]|nr:hypothetical protein [Bacilli bacterium]